MKSCEHLIMKQLLVDLLSHAIILAFVRDHRDIESLDFVVFPYLLLTQDCQRYVLLCSLFSTSQPS